MPRATKRLTAKQKAKIDRIKNPRDTVLSLKFTAHDVQEWKKEAERKSLSLTEWIEWNNNRAIDCTRPL